MNRSSEFSSHTAFTEIPVIDISGLYSSELNARQSVADQLAEAARDVGFFYIQGHRISELRKAQLIEAAKTFFAQPTSLKMNAYIGLSENHSGYVPEGEEQFYTPNRNQVKADHKESYDLGFELVEAEYRRPMLGRNQWPELKGFREAVSAYYTEALSLGHTLFRGFALALGLPEEHFVEQAQRPPSQLRLVHYPYDDAAEDREGIGAHTDYECFTLLLPTSEGLQVLNGAAEWIDVPHKPECFVVNIGDMLEILSNGRFVATSHRVRKVKEERYSFPLFCSLDYDTRIEPVLPPLPGAAPDRYMPLVCGDHLYAQTIQTFQYLRQRLAAGEIALPGKAKALASFGKFRAAIDRSLEG